LGEDEDEDALGPGAKGDKLRIIICMTPEASRRLLSSGRYLQSDIGFKRIVGYKEFELAGMERDSNTSTLFFLYASFSVLTRQPQALFFVEFISIA
jgi:hypothetical protein